MHNARKSADLRSQWHILFGSTYNHVLCPSEPSFSALSTSHMTHCCFLPPPEKYISRICSTCEVLWSQTQSHSSIHPTRLQESIWYHPPIDNMKSSFAFAVGFVLVLALCAESSPTGKDVTLKSGSVVRSRPAFNVDPCPNMCRGRFRFARRECLAARSLGCRMRKCRRPGSFRDPETTVGFICVMRTPPPTPSPKPYPTEEPKKPSPAAWLSSRRWSSEHHFVRPTSGLLIWFDS